MTAPLILHDDQSRQIIELCERLRHAADAKEVFVVEKDGLLVGSSAEQDRVDAISLASLVAGEVAATGGLAKLIGESEFSVMLHEGVHENIHISVIEGRLILVVIFDRRASLGLVRLRVKQASRSLARIVDGLVARSRAPGAARGIARITDEDINNLLFE